MDRPDVDTVLWTLALDSLAQGAILEDEERIEATNYASSILHALDKNTMAKRWWHCEPWHPAIGRAMRIDREQTGGAYALDPFRLWSDGERHVILAAHPTPRLLGPVDGDWLGIETVLAWDPVADTVTIPEDCNAQLVGRFEDDNEGTIFASPRDFFTEWAKARAQFFVRWCEAQKGEWVHPVAEHDAAPGKLLVGALKDARLSNLPATLHVRGLDPREVNRHILRQANLPRAVAQTERAAA